MLAWLGDPFDPDDVSEAKITPALAKLVRRRTLNRAAYLKRIGRQN